MIRAREKSGNLRPPIVTVLGHVDHGKTTLLDYISKTNVAQKEVGGITQRIGASVIETKEGKKITFIDTPGHAVFANMRSRGAKVADIAILVVAADDGVKPQSKEALGFIMTANIPYVVAATKVDLPTADAEMVQDQLMKEGVLFEGKGGEVPFVSVSGKTGKGVDELLDVVSLVSEIHEVRGDAEASLEAVVIETGKDKRGPYASLIVRNGTLRLGDTIVTETTTARVRGLFDYLSRSIQEVGPGQPVQILGFSELPTVGSRVWEKGEGALVEATSVRRLVNVDSEKKVFLVVKAGSAGSLEAILDNLPPEVGVIASGVGDVTESDVFAAKAASLSSSNAVNVFCFESKVPSNVIKLAETEGVKIESFKIIYELFERASELVKKGEGEVFGKAEILASFTFDNKKVAGCKVLIGKITKTDKLKLLREGKNVGELKIASMRRGKVDILEAKQGEELGIIFTPQLDFAKGDVLISVEK